MKRVLLFISIYALSYFSYAQKSYPLKKMPHIGININLKDFITPDRLGSESLGRVLANHQWAKISDMQLGFGVNYVDGISNHIDFVANLNGSTVKPALMGNLTDTKKRFLLDLTVRLNYKFLTDNYIVVPYATIGVGASMYNASAFAANVPIGGGLQFNLGKKNGFLCLQTLYNFPVNPSSTMYNFTYSLGATFPLHKAKK